MSLAGIRIVPHLLAERVFKQACIKRTTVQKRRRGWTLSYETKREPCAYQAGNTIYMHPTLYAALKDPQCPKT